MSSSKVSESPSVNKIVLVLSKEGKNEQTKDKSSDSEEKASTTHAKPSKSKGDKKESSGKHYKTGRWTDEEHDRFMKGIELFGKDWK